MRRPLGWALCSFLGWFLAALLVFAWIGGTTGPIWGFVVALYGVASAHLIDRFSR